MSPRPAEWSRHKRFLGQTVFPKNFIQSNMPLTLINDVYSLIIKHQEYTYSSQLIWGAVKSPLKLYFLTQSWNWKGWSAGLALPYTLCRDIGKGVLWSCFFFQSGLWAGSAFTQSHTRLHKSFWKQNIKGDPEGTSSATTESGLPGFSHYLT